MVKTIDEKELDDLTESLKTAKKFRLDYGRGHRLNGLYHIRGIVDDRYVIRRRAGSAWVYNLVDIWYFLYKQKGGRLEIE